MKKLNGLLLQIEALEKDKKNLEKKVKALDKTIESLEQEVEKIIGEDMALNGCYEDENIIITYEEKVSEKINVCKVLSNNLLRNRLLELVEEGMPCSISTKFKKEIKALDADSYKSYINFDLKKAVKIEHK